MRPGVGQAILWQIPNRQPRWLHDSARIGFLESPQDLQQRGLPGAVRAAQADTLAVADLPRHVIEQGAVAEGLREI